MMELAKKPAEGEAWDVLLVGSGPSSLTAAIYTTRGAASTLILGGAKWGGQLMLTTTVDNFPGFPDGVYGPELMGLMRKQAERFGALVIEENVTELDVSSKPFTAIAGGKKYKAKSVIIATGAEISWLGVPGEQKLLGRGVSSCAPCDAPFFKNKKVAVVGGGDSAMEEALVLTKYATEVTIIHRRDQFKASKAMQQKVFNNKNIKIIWNTEVKEILGEQKVEGVKLLNVQTSKTSELAVDGIFVAIGHTPSTKILSGKIDLDEKGYAKYPINTPGVFVAGDVHDYRYKQAVTAAGFGCMAAMDALKYLEELKG